MNLIKHLDYHLPLMRQINILIITTILGVTCSFSTGLSNCQVGWEEYRGYCYKIFSEGLEWYDARDTCRKLGGYLPSIHDENTNMFLRNLTINTNGTDRAWIGLNDISIEKTYNWSDGSPYNFTNWSKDEPNSKDRNEDCVEMSSSDGWDDVDCHYLKHYICSRKKALAKCQDGWEENSEYCYKVFSEGITWHNATDRCQKLGGYLPSIPDDTTDRFIRNLISNTKDTKRVWIGLNDLSIEKEYIWSDGSPYKFANWSDGQPDSDDKTEDCVEIFSSGGWNDIDCYYLNHYICSLKIGMYSKFFSMSLVNRLLHYVITADLWSARKPNCLIIRSVTESVGSPSSPATRANGYVSTFIAKVRALTVTVPVSNRSDKPSPTTAGSVDVSSKGTVNVD
ncbi:C-type mannose receptor 2 [Bulinus truncatus]|nr:C-type mannose receptor 2 [Bulinus truncatus]